MDQWWAFNKESIVLAAAVAIVSGPLFALGHEATKWLIYSIKRKLGK